MTMATPTETTAAATEVVSAEPYDESETGGEADDAVELPTVELTNFDEETGFDAQIGHGTLAVAETIATSVRDVEVYGGESTRKLDYSDKRAEFVSVTFFKDASRKVLHRHM